MIIVTRHRNDVKIYINRKYIISFHETNWITNDFKYTATKLTMSGLGETDANTYLIKETPKQLLDLLKWNSYDIKDELL